MIIQVIILKTLADESGRIWIASEKHSSVISQCFYEIFTYFVKKPNTINDMFSKVPEITISIFNIHMNKTRHVFFLPFLRLELQFLEFPYYSHPCWQHWQWILVGTKRYFDRMSKEWFHQKICSIGAISYFFGTKNDMEKDSARESEF